MKRILVKVSFDLEIFEKELSKAKSRLLEVEINQLREWCYATFSDLYYSLIEKILGTTTSSIA